MRRLIVLLMVSALAASACAQTSPDARNSGAERISHIHGVGIGTAGELYVATHFGLFARDGNSWSRRSKDRNDHMGFTLSPAGMWRSGHPASGGNLGVQESSDGGRTWKTLSPVASSPVDFHAMTATRSQPATLYGWPSSRAGLFRSTDNGKTWEKASAEGLPTAVGALAASGRDGVVYATTDRGLYRSTNGGDTFERASEQLLVAVATGGEPEVIHASKARGGGVVRSADAGATWEPAGSDLGDSTVVALAVSADGDTVLAGDRNGGVWISKDGGASWSSLPTS